MREKHMCSHMTISSKTHPHVPFSIHTLWYTNTDCNCVYVYISRWMRSRSNGYSDTPTLVRDSEVVRTMGIYLHMHIYRAWWAHVTPVGPPLPMSLIFSVSKIYNENNYNNQKKIIQCLLLLIEILIMSKLRCFIIKVVIKLYMYFSNNISKIYVLKVVSF